MTNIESKALLAILHLIEEGVLKEFTYNSAFQCFNIHFVLGDVDQKRIVGINRLLTLYRKWLDGKLYNLDEA